MDDERGFALVGVLWTLVLLTLLAGLLLQSTQTSATLERNAWQRLQAEAAAETGFTWAILSLLDQRPDKRWPVDGRDVKMTANGQSLTIAIQDELGRIDLNAAPRDLLVNLFAAAGQPRSAADALADAVVERRLGDSASRRATTSEATRRIAFRLRDELLLLPGATERLFDQIAPAITVHARRPSIDPAVAPRLALLALSRGTKEEVDTILRQRTATSSLPTGTITPTSGRAFTIQVEVTQNQQVFRFERAVRILPQGKPAFWIVDNR